MTKVMKVENWRVEVEIPKPWFVSSKETLERAYKDAGEEVVNAIRRHVDNIGEVYVSCDESEVCSFCEYDWEVDEYGCPTCCHDGIVEWGKQHPFTKEDCKNGAIVCELGDPPDLEGVIGEYEDGYCIFWKGNRGECFILPNVPDYSKWVLVKPAPENER